MDNSISSDLIRGHIETIILQALIDGDKYPQQISDVIEEKSEKKYKINQATLYSSLTRLETLKYLKSYWNDATDGRRKYYKITDSGINYVNNNIEKWSYSRPIIEKLMGISQKYDNLPVSKQENQNYSTKIFNQPVIIRNNDNLGENHTKIQQKPLINEEINDLQFREIINKLIKNNQESIKNQKNNDEIPEQLYQLEKEDVDNSENQAKFNDTLLDSKYISTRDYSAERIDFSDLKQTCEKEGIKVRISSKDSINKKGRILINKLNFATSLLISLLLILQIFLINSVWGLQANLPTGLLFGLCLATLFLPIICGIIYFRKNRKTLTKLTFDNIFISLITLFNVVLISFALNLIFDIDLLNVKITLYSLVTPITLSFNVVLFYVSRYLLSKINIFKIC